MAGRHLSAAFITNPVSIAYLTGFHANPHERLMALAVGSREVTLVVPAIEQEKATHRAPGAKVVAWRDGEDAYGLVASVLGSQTEIGVEKDHITLSAAEMLASRTGASELVDVGAEIRKLRLVKTEDEIALLAKAAAITGAVAKKVMSALRRGQTETEVAMAIGAAIAELGGGMAFPPLVQSGPNSALPHLEPSNRELADGDFVLLDFGASCGGYKADTTRMAFIGDPTPRHEEIHRVVLEAHDAAIAAVRPGVTAGAIDAAARRVIEAAGYGPQFFHRVGHGLGLDGHEDPSLDPGSELILEPGMVFTIEPGIYIEGFGGVRIEDDIVVRPDGHEVLVMSDPHLLRVR